LTGLGHTKIKFKVNKYFIAIFIICIIFGYFIEAALLFLFVMLHEFSHAIVAVIFGLKIGDIELFPFGGVARINNIDMVEPFKEILISVAGPLFNVMVAALVFFLNNRGIHVPNYEFIMNTNIGLGIFNMLPGLPLDGGRILRVFIEYFVGYRKATKAAVFTGKVIAVLMFIIGIFAVLNGAMNISLFILPLFIFVSASKEEENIMYTVIKDVMIKNKNIKGNLIMEVTQICTYEEAFVRDVLKHFDVNKYNMVVVLDKSMKVKGVLSESEIFEALTKSGSDIRLKNIA
jgi:stage IV sporulation protein FB